MPKCPGSEVSVHLKHGRLSAGAWPIRSLNRPISNSTLLILLTLLNLTLNLRSTKVNTDYYILSAVNTNRGRLDLLYL